MIRWLLATAALIFVSSGVGASGITYQGKLVTTSGQAVSGGSHDVVFRLFDVSGGPNDALWTSNAVQVSPSAGLFTTTFDPPINLVASHADLWLEVVVDGVTLLPRQKLQSVPYAYVAQMAAPDSITADSLVADAASLSKITNGALTIDAGNLVITTPGAGFQFPDGTVQTTAAGPSAGDGVPAGFFILGETTTPPAGYSYTGQYMLTLNDFWKIQAAMPSGRSLGAASIVDGVLYNNGAASPSQSVNLKYDIATGIWSTYPGFLTPRTSHSGAELNGRIYSIGGDNLAGTATPSVEYYDTSNGSRGTIHTLPLAVYTPIAVGFNGKLWVMGGQQANGNYTANAYTYNELTDSWDAAANLPVGRSTAGVCVFDNKLWVAGGLSASVRDELLVSDPASPGWVTKTKMTKKRYGFTLVPCNGFLYAIGGNDGSGPIKDVEVYDTVQDVWRTCAPLLNARCYHTAAVVNGKIMIMGGSVDTLGAPSTRVDLYTPNVPLYVHRKD